MVLSNLSTEEAVRTSVLSSRWVDVWKWRSYLVLDMNMVLDSTPKERLQQVSVQLARLMTKVRQFPSLLSFHLNHFIYEGLSLYTRNPRDYVWIDDCLFGYVVEESTI